MKDGKHKQMNKLILLLVSFEIRRLKTIYVILDLNMVNKKKKLIMHEIFHNSAWLLHHCALQLCKNKSKNVTTKKCNNDKNMYCVSILITMNIHL